MAVLCPLPDSPHGAAFVHDQHHDPRSAVFFIQSAQNLSGIGHLRDHFFGYVAAGLDRIKTGFHHQVDDPDLLFRGNELFDSLESVAGCFDNCYQC